MSENIRDLEVRPDTGFSDHEIAEGILASYGLERCIGCDRAHTTARLVFATLSLQRAQEHTNGQYAGLLEDDELNREKLRKTMSSVVDDFDDLEAAWVEFEKFIEENEAHSESLRPKAPLTEDELDSKIQDIYSFMGECIGYDDRLAWLGDKGSVLRCRSWGPQSYIVNKVMDTVTAFFDAD